MRKFLSVLALVISAGALFGQENTPKGNSKISGSIIDAATNKPIEYATIALNDPATDKPVDGTVCDDNGKFTLNKVAEGKYNVVVSFIGFETQTFPVNVDGKKNIDLGSVKLKEEEMILKEVTVEAQKVLIEEKVDRTIYNAENDATTAGGDATDVLKRVPMLSVDMDGNVSMRGSSNVRVLINGKPSTIAASSVADALKMIPADQIKTVEVITSPSAKYDAEGSGGIINIVTKKNTLQGATLGIDTGIGLRGSNLGLNGNYRTKKMGFSLGGWGRASYNVHGNYENDQLTKDPVSQAPLTRTIQSADTRNQFLFGRYNLGWDYDINKYNFINGSVSYGLRSGTNYQDDQLSQKFDANDALLSSTLRDSKTNDQSGTVDVNLSYTRTYDKAQKELSFSGQYSRNNRVNDFINTNFGEDDIIDTRLKNTNDSYDQEITFQFDYQTPINDNQLVEFGGKEIMRKVSSDYSYYTAEGSDGPFVPSDNAQTSNIFNYDQNVMAGYLSYTYSTKKSYSFKVGTRYEYTNVEANFENPEGGETDIPSYGVFVPSINVSKKLKNGNMVKLAYNKRIQRPSIRYLNPNIQASNPNDISYGNPNLDPEYTDNFELSYSTLIKGTSLNFSTFVRNTYDAIQSVKTPLPGGAIETTYDNIGQESAYGGSVFANVNIGSKLSLNGGFDLYYAVLDNNVPSELYNAHNEGWVISGRLFGNYSLSKGWGLQFFGFARGRDVQLQGTRGNFRMYSLAVRKEFNEKRGSIGFGAENFLSPSIKMKNEFYSSSLEQKSVNEMFNLSFRVNFSYRIGKMSFDNQPRRRKSVSNDDLKQGGDGNGMEGGAQGGQGGSSGQFGGGQGRRGAAAGVAATTPAKLPVADPAAEVNAVGTWTYTIESPQGGEGTLTINKEGDKYTGKIFNKRFDRESELSSVTLAGNELNFSYEAAMGGNQMTISVKAIITGDDMTGNMTVGQFGTFPLKAKRAQ